MNNRIKNEEEGTVDEREKRLKKDEKIKGERKRERRHTNS